MSKKGNEEYCVLLNLIKSTFLYQKNNHWLFKVKKSSNTKVFISGILIAQIKD